MRGAIGIDDISGDETVRAQIREAAGDNAQFTVWESRTTMHRSRAWPVSWASNEASRKTRRRQSSLRYGLFAKYPSHDIP